MRGVVYVVLLCMLGAVETGCGEARREPVTGRISVDLVGTATTGAVYRLRDAIIAVDGPTATVFDTEDDPDRTSLSADVEPGDYTATLQPGWRLERIDGATPTTVSATLISDNPALFTVLPEQRTTVPLRFRVDDQDVDLTQGYDIVLEIDEGIPSPGEGYQTIDAPSLRTRLVFDAARSTIYAVNRLDQQVERFSFANGQWAADAPVVIPQLTDVALMPDGQTLIVLDRAAISDVALAGGSFTLVKRKDNPDPFCGGFFDVAAAGSSNKVFIVHSLAGCSGFSSSFIYDAASHSLSFITSLFNATAAASADGSRVYAGGSGLFPPDEVVIYNSQANTLTRSTVQLNLDAISVSGDASRVILQNTFVYSRALTLLGNLAPGGVALASRDSSRAFVYLDDAPGPRLAIYDLNGALQAGALFPLVRTIRLPDSPNASRGSLGAITMAIDDNDAFVFISGDRRLLVVPVD